MPKNREWYDEYSIWSVIRTIVELETLQQEAIWVKETLLVIAEKGKRYDRYNKIMMLTGEVSIIQMKEEVQKVSQKDLFAKLDYNGK